MQIIVDNLAVKYELKGKGRLVLLLHGWGDSLITYTELMNYFSSKFQVVALDLPGFGGSEVAKEAWNLDNYCFFIAHFLDKLELPNPYAIVGHSNGGAIAIRALSMDSLRADKLILIAASGIRNGKHNKRLLIKAVAKIGKVTTFWLPKPIRQKLQRKLYGTIGSDMMVVPQLNETFKLTVKQDVQVDAAKLKLPVLLIFAKNDPAIPFRDAITYHNLIPNSKLEEIDGSDHFIHHDQPDLVFKLIGAFL